MSSTLRRRMTLADYLELEARSDTKHEYVDGEVIAMAGASLEHSGAREGLSTAVRVALAAAGKRCLTLSSDTRVKISETGLYAYPDMTVVCETPQHDSSANPPSLLNPLVIFEVLSESTEAWDRGAKMNHYKSRASLQEVVLVSVEERRVEVHRRLDGRWWQTASFTDGDEVELASLGIGVPVASIFEQLDLL